MTNAGCWCRRASIRHLAIAAESLDAWGQEQEHEHEGERLALTPEDLGLRTTYLATGRSDPGIDLAIPFAVEG